MLEESARCGTNSVPVPACRMHGDWQAALLPIVNKKAWSGLLVK
jgi:hypothetical protein